MSFTLFKSGHLPQSDIAQVIHLLAEYHSHISKNLNKSYFQEENGNYWKNRWKIYYSFNESEKNQFIKEYTNMIKRTNDSIREHDDCSKNMPMSSQSSKPVVRSLFFPSDSFFDQEFAFSGIKYTSSPCICGKFSNIQFEFCGRSLNTCLNICGECLFQFPSLPYRVWGPSLLRAVQPGSTLAIETQLLNDYIERNKPLSPEYFQQVLKLDDPEEIPGFLRFPMKSITMAFIGWEILSGRGCDGYLTGELASSVFNLLKSCTEIVICALRSKAYELDEYDTAQCLIEQIYTEKIPVNGVNIAEVKRFAERQFEDHEKDTPLEWIKWIDHLKTSPDLANHASRSSLYVSKCKRLLKVKKQRFEDEVEEIYKRLEMAREKVSLLEKKVTSKQQIAFAGKENKEQEYSKEPTEIYKGYRKLAKSRSWTEFPERRNFVNLKEFKTSDPVIPPKEKIRPKKVNPILKKMFKFENSDLEAEIEDKREEERLEDLFNDIDDTFLDEALVDAPIANQFAKEARDEELKNASSSIDSDAVLGSQISEEEEEDENAEDIRNGDSEEQSEEQSEEGEEDRDFVVPDDQVEESQESDEEEEMVLQIPEENKEKPKKLKRSHSEIVETSLDDELEI